LAQLRWLCIYKNLFVFLPESVCHFPAKIFLCFCQKVYVIFHNCEC